MTNGLTVIISAWVSPVMLQPHEAEAAPLGVNPIPTLFVTTTSVTQGGNAVDGQCDLWEALQAIVNANLGSPPTYHECTAANGLPNTIGFSGAAAGGTLAVGGNVDLPFVWGDTTILGPVTIDGGGLGGDHHLFRLAGGATLTLIGVTAKNSHTSGAGPVVLDTNGGTVNLIGSSITGNTADNDGGAIDSRGDINIVLSNFSGNQALGLVNGTGYGGAINMHGYGRLTIAQSNFAGNIATGGGGAVYVSNQNTQVSDSVFNGNIASPITQTATTGGGALYVATNASVQLERTAFTANLSPSGNGGAMYAAINATVFVTDTSFNGNLAGGLTNAQLGGGIYNQAQLQIVRSAFLNNNAVQGSGGGLVVDKGSKATVANTLFAFNTVPLGVGGGIVITNTQTGGPASTLIAKNVTLSQNAAKPPSGNGGGIHNSAGHSVQLGNTILDGNLSGNCVGTITSLGHNLDSGTSCGLSGAGDLTNNSNAKLDSPAPHGGPIASLLSEKLLAGSDAIDAGDNAICAASPVNNEDQNGGSRPKDGDGNASSVCDIGAYEDDTLKAGYGSTPSQPGPITFGNATVGTILTTTLTILSTGDATLVVSTPLLGGVNAGDFGISTTFPINVLSSGSSKDIVLRCTPSAAGTRTATLSLATNDLAHVLVIYDLSCDGTAVPRAGYDSSPDAPGPLTFAKTVVGQSSTVRLKVKEAGNLTLNISSTVLSGANASDFSVTTATPFQILNNGAPQDLVIQCTPSDVNLRTATLTINNNDPNRSSVPYALTCPAIPPSNYLVAGTSITNTASIAYLDGPYGVAVSPDGNNVFAIASNSGRILSFARATDSGLTYQNSVDPFGVLAGGRLTAVSPDGKQVYAAGYNTHEVVGFDRNAADGSATLKIGGGNSVSSLGGAFGVAISPDGSAVYATGYLSNSLVAFYRNPSTGILSKTQTIVSPSALAGATSISVSPDGLNVYVGGYTSTVNGQLAVFKRNVLNGAVTYQQTKSNVTGFCFIDCVAGLNGAYQTVVSPDGLHVYTVGRYDNAIAVFDRAPQDGTLTFNTVYKNGVGGITGLAGANAIVFSPDGEHVFVSSYDDKAVAVFLWDAASGQLGELQVIQRNPFGTATGNPPLQGARDLDISPDGKAVYVAGNLDDAIAVLLVANPTPILNNLTPASTLAGGSAFSLTVHGENFVTGATVYWNGSARATTFINSTQLLAAINASDVASGGGYPVKVRNPSPGASFSNIMTFTVSSNIFANPVPSITYINPQGTVAGSGVVTLTLNGTGFISSVFGVSVVRWNGSNLPTTFINSTQLQATVPATATVNAGIAGVTVANGGSSSNVVEFTIASPLQNPPPSLTQLSPVWVFSYGAGSPQVTLIVTGTNFVNGAKVQWNGVDLPTTFVNSTKLKATVTSAKLALPNNAVITAENPTPGGGTSNTLSFDVRKLYRNLIPLLIR